VFRRESPTMLPPGLSAKAPKPAPPLWGFSHLGRQTECERIPRPRNRCWIYFGQITPAGRLLVPRNTCFPRLKFPSLLLSCCSYLDDVWMLPVAKLWMHSINAVRNMGAMFC